MIRTTTALATLVAFSTGTAAQDRPRMQAMNNEWAITPELRRAVDDGLRFLAERQNQAGYWAQDVGFKLNTDYRKMELNAAHVGVSALALMSFLAGGHLPGRGRYGDNIERGLHYVLRCVSDTGFIQHNGTRMYSHAFAALFLAEIYGMTHSTDVRKALQNAVNIIVDSQNGEGGWRYKPFARESDMSITVCQVLALRSARNVGITVPAQTIRDAETYVRRSAVLRGDFGGGRDRGFRPSYNFVNEGGAFRYQLRGHSRATFPLTAAGITTLHAAGIYDDAIISDAFDYLDEQMPLFNSTYSGHYFFYYGHYYAVQAYYTAGGSRWNNYFRMMSQRLLQMQESNGSWPCTTGPGDVFSTAVATLVLQIPFQYLPIFQR